MKNRKAFTLIELLVVIAIIALLLSILMPALKKTRDQGRRVVCLSNQNQVLLAMEAFAHSNDQWYPVQSDGQWEGVDGSLLSGNFLESAGLFQCPSDNADFGPIDPPIPSEILGVDITERTPENYRTYGYNMHYSGWINGGAGWRKPMEIRIPQKTILISETPARTNVLYQNSYDCYFGPVPPNRETSRGYESGYTHWSGYDIWAASASESFVHKMGCNYGFSDGHAEYIIVSIEEEWPPFNWFDNGLYKSNEWPP